MLGGINPAHMKGMMKKMGISQSELSVKRVIFEMNSKSLIIENPNVMQIKMQGQKSFQVSGDIVEEDSEKFSSEDVEMVMNQSGKSKDEVHAALEKSEGDIAEAIIALK